MKEFKDIGLELATEAGELIRDNFTIGMKKEWKTDNSPLTATDKTINSLVIATIKKHFPDHGILGEEESDFDNNDFVWVCDPIDGTIPFSHGIPTSTFSLALTHHGDVKLGIVYDPYIDRMFVAEKGKGSFLNSKKIIVSDADSFKNTVVSVGSWPEAYYNLHDVKLAVQKEGARSIGLACYTYGGMLVACGEMIAATYASRNPWDVAAIKIIVEEAGGKCTDMQGNDQRYDRPVNGFVATNGKVHSKILSIISQFAAKNG